MTERALRNWVALLIIGGHLASFILLFVATTQRWVKAEFSIPAAAVIAPLFALYLVAALKWLASDWGNKSSKKKLAGLFPLVALTFVGLFSVSLPLLIVLKSNNTISSPSDFKLYITLLETCYAGSLGFIVDRLFRNG